MKRSRQETNSPMSMEKAIKNDEIAAVKALIGKGADPNQLVDSWNDKSLLMLCIEENKLEIAKCLIEAGANTTKRVDYYGSPLNYAISKGNLEMVELLLENGADLTLSQGLVYAIKNNNLEMVPELIKRGADVNRPNGRSEFPIMCAIENNNLEILKLLLENGANINFVGSNGNTPLINSVRLMYLPLIKCLIKDKADLNTKNANNETPLSISLSNEDFRTFKLLIESGADPKLASAAIDNKAKNNADLAAYMTKQLEKKNICGSQLKGFTGHEDTLEK